MNQTAPSLLLLIPAYNEEERIGPVLREYAEHFARHYPGRFELVVVLNGCRDNTLGVVRQVAGEFPSVSAVDFPAPIGKGGALIEGLKLHPKSEVIGYVDADGATPPQALHQLVDRLGEADCVIGSRWLPGSVLHQAQTTTRRLFSRCFHLIVETLFWMHIKDTQCPCKVMKREAIQHIHPALTVADLAFDVNLLYSLKHAGFKVLEVPIEWTDKLGSKVTASLFRSSLVMFLSVVQLRIIYSPLNGLLRICRPMVAWLYRKLRAPQPLAGPMIKPPPKVSPDKTPAVAPGKPG